MLHTIHPQFNYCGTVLKESDHHHILRVKFDARMTFEKNHCLVSRPAFQRLGFVRKSWRIFHDRFLLITSLFGIVLPVLKYCCAVWRSAADTHLKLLNCVVSCASFFNWGMFECSIVYQRWSVAILCMLNKIRCDPMHPLKWCSTCAICASSVTLGALVAHRYTYGLPHDFHSILSISQEWSWWPCVLLCGTDRFYVQGQCFFIYFF